MAVIARNFLDVIVPIGNLLLLWIVAYSDWRDVKVMSRA